MATETLETQQDGVQFLSDELTKFTRIVVIVLLLLAIIMTLWQVSIFPVNDVLDWKSIAEKVGISVFVFVVILEIQKLVKHKTAYTIALSGFACLFLGSIDGLLREFLQSDVSLGPFSFYDIQWIGFFLVTLAFIQYVRLLVRSDDKYMFLDSQYRNLVVALPEGVIFHSLDELITYANKKITGILGWEVEEVIGRRFSDFVEPQEVDRIKAESRKHSEGIASVYTLRMVTKHGERKIVRVSAVPKGNSQGDIEGVISVISDITKQVESEEEKALQQREKELYASLLRHDLGNDVQVILGYIDAVLMLYHDMPDTGREMLDSAYAASSRMANLLKALGTPREPSDENFVKFLEGIAEQAEKANRGLTCEVIADDTVRQAYTSGSTLLPMAFENLLRNSAQHAGLEAHVSIEVTRQNGSVLITISDDGPGIPNDIRPKIFQRGASTKGGGLGLYLTREIIRTCGGTIELIDSNENQGAVFEIHLPLKL
jgi:PAS domain S-box-containing protein